MNRIDRATIKASNIPFTKGQHRVYSIVYDKRGRTLSEASNTYTKSSPIMKSLGEDVGMPEKQFWHAECLAIHRIPYGSLPYRIVIARVNREGESLPSAPCKVCANAIKKRGIEVIEHII